jgi:hypothetical protein
MTKEPNPIRWAGVCAGGYFAAAAFYVGNVVVLAAVRAEDRILAGIMAGFPLICIVMGCLVLAGKRWTPKWAVVVAAGFAAIHLVGLAYLFFIPPASGSPLTLSLQWQLGAALFFLWLSVLGSAFRLARCSGAPPYRGDASENAP